VDAARIMQYEILHGQHPAYALWDVRILGQLRVDDFFYGGFNLRLRYCANSAEEVYVKLTR